MFVTKELKKDNKQKRKLIKQILINDENVILHINVDGDTDIKGEWCANKMWPLPPSAAIIPVQRRGAAWEGLILALVVMVHIEWQEYPFPDLEEEEVKLEPNKLMSLLIEQN